MQDERSSVKKHAQNALLSSSIVFCLSLDLHRNRSFSKQARLPHSFGRLNVTHFCRTNKPAEPMADTPTKSKAASQSKKKKQATMPAEQTSVAALPWLERESSCRVVSKGCLHDVLHHPKPIAGGVYWHHPEATAQQLYTVPSYRGRFMSVPAVHTVLPAF